MAGVPQSFQTLSNVLANYNFADIASGTGFINFYAGKTVDLQLLSNNTFYSDTVATTSTSAPVSATTLMLDLDFDVVINRPLNIAGLSILNTPVGIVNGHAGGTGNCQVIAKLRKWDGVSETDICNNASSFYVPPVTTVGTTYGMLATDLTIPLTHFKIGETLRLTLELWVTDSHGVGGDLKGVLGHDPKNRTVGFDTTGNVPSQLVFQCPVRLNL